MRESIIRISNKAYRKLFGEEETKIIVDVHAILDVLKSLPTETVINILFELPIEIIELYIINMDIDKDF